MTLKVDVKNGQKVIFINVENGGVKFDENRPKNDPL
jgi:hypothetical protein